jgi:methyl-accepting chemotaxis protein
MFSRLNIGLKYGLLFATTLALMAGAILIGVSHLKTGMLRNEAQAVASQVVSFRAWVAKTGMVWVDNLPEDFHDFLTSYKDEGGKTFYGKNPALATRELSEIANRSSSHATFRVTSDQYRHPSNAPDPFESRAISGFAADKGLKYLEETVETDYRYAQPIFVTEACLKCHGDPADAPAAVVQKYGSDKAFGYKVGDVRGIISVRLPDLTWKDLVPTLANPYTIGALILAILINFLFAANLIRRLKRLTAGAEAIARGELDTQLAYRSPATSSDELDHVYNAVDLLRNAIRVAIKRLHK